MTTTLVTNKEREREARAFTPSSNSNSEYRLRREDEGQESGSPHPNYVNMDGLWAAYLCKISSSVFVHLWVVKHVSVFKAPTKFVNLNFIFKSRHKVLTKFTDLWLHREFWGVFYFRNLLGATVFVCVTRVHNSIPLFTAAVWVEINGIPSKEIYRTQNKIPVISGFDKTLLAILLLFTRIMKIMFFSRCLWDYNRIN